MRVSWKLSSGEHIVQGKTDNPHNQPGKKPLDSALLYSRMRTADFAAFAQASDTGTAHKAAATALLNALASMHSRYRRSVTAKTMIGFKLDWYFSGIVTRSLEVPKASE
jgi:hypothetical protein